MALEDVQADIRRRIVQQIHELNRDLELAEICRMGVGLRVQNPHGQGPFRLEALFNDDTEETTDA